MKIGEYEQMMAYLKKPNRLFTSKPQDTIGGGTIQGENLGSRTGFAGPELIKQGEDKGKYTFFIRNPEYEGKGKGQSPRIKQGPFNTLEQAQAAYDKRQSQMGTIKQAGRDKALIAHSEQINNFVNNFYNDNIEKYSVRDYDKFEKDLLKAFKKSGIKDIPGRKSIYKDLPNIATADSKVPFTSKFESKPLVRGTSGAESTYKNYYKNLFYSAKIETDPSLQKRIGEYLDYYNEDKKHYKGAPADRKAVRAKYADTLSNLGDVMFILGDDRVGAGNFRSGIVKKFFPEKMETYNRKKQISNALYNEKIAQIESKLTPAQLKKVLGGETSIKRFMEKQTEKLKDIFDLSSLDEGLRFNLDHAEGIAEIAKMDKASDIMRGLNNLVGMTAARNYELGWKGYSTSRKNLINEIKKGNNVDENFEKLNKITGEAYPELKGQQAYSLKGGQVIPTKDFTFKYSPEKAFQQYFTELSTKEKGAKGLLQQAKPGSELVQFLTKDEQTYQNIADNLFNQLKENKDVSLKELTSLRNTYKNQKEEALQEFGRLFCRTNSATGGRINLAQAGSANICSPEEMLSNMKKDRAIAQGTDEAAALAKGRLLKAGKSVGKVLGYVAAPADIALELAFAGPSLLRGDVQGAINATTYGLLGGGKTGMEQVGEKFGTDSTEYALYGIEESIKNKMVAMDGLEKLFLQSEQLGLIPSEQGVMQKQIGLEPQQKALLKQFVNQFKNLGEIDQKAQQDFETFYPRTVDKMKNTEALQNIANFSTSEQPLAGKLDPNTVEGFIKSGGGVFEKEMLPRFTLPQYEENIQKLKDLRIADFPLQLQSQLAEYEKSQMPSQQQQDLMLQQQLNTPLGFVVPYDQLRYRGYKEGGRINFSNGGRLSFAEGPEDPSKRKFLKNVGIGGGVIGGLTTGLINLMDLFKGGKTGVAATKAAESEAEKIFLDLIDLVKNKGVMNKLDNVLETKVGVKYKYKGVEVLEDGENIELRFETDKGAPAVVEYRKPGYEVDPEAGTSVQVPGEFTYEAQEIGRYGPDGDVDLDFVEEIVDPIENIKSMAKEKK